MANLTTSNMAIYQHYKLYIEGEECPFVSAVISCGVGGTPEMVIQLVPYRMLRNLKERTKVHLYFNDPVDGSLKLLFDGEIKGDGYVKTPSSRTLTYSVSHVSAYLDEILISFEDPWTFGMQAMPTAGAMGESKKSEDATYNHLIEQYFNAGKLKEVEGKSFQEYFRKFIELIIGDDKRRATQTEAFKFFLVKIEEWKLFDRIAVMPQQAGGVLDSAFTLKDFIDDEELMKFWREHAINTTGGVYSIFQLFNRIFRQIFYVPVVISAPFYKDQAQQSVLYKPQSLFVSPPTCNVIWPSMYNSFAYSRDFKAQPTRLFAQQVETIFDTGKFSSANYIWAPSGEIRQVNEAGDKEKPVNIKEALNTVVKSTGEDKVGVRVAQHQANDVVHRYINWLGGSGVAEQSLKNHKKVLKLVDYELTRQRLRTVSSSVGMVFNPYIVPGFPCLIIDNPDSGMHIYGYVMAVTHNIHASGGSRTTVDVSYMRQYDDEQVSVFPVADEVWADEDRVYQEILGVSSIKSSDARFNPDGITDGTKIPLYIEAAMREKEFYDFTYNAYVRSYRPVMTKAEYDSSGFGVSLDISYDEAVQEKVKEYRRWVVNRIAGAPAAENIESLVLGDVQDTSSIA